MIQTIGRWLDYLSYVFQSTNRHGIHSPFVYSFADSILYKPVASIAPMILPQFINEDKILEIPKTKNSEQE